MTKTLPLSEVKAKLSILIAGIVKRADEIIITRNGKPVAVLMSPDEYDSWRETQEIKRDPDLMRQIRESEAAYKRGDYQEYRTKEELDELFWGKK
ncbi:MAG TPA: type II toxin-antitoxin system Phd/YefM family antitoxin [Candidatus Omnitrophota bacterium]|jgi:prevent-host-death family protein|nr:type II toxin-antitoxin system Phd/YefM family antitoxin [Candidatus Omnitrophota bacterium]